MTFQDENDYLIHLLYCAIHDTVPETVPPGISLEKVFEAGKAHEVANIAYRAVLRLPEQPDPALMSRWRDYYYNAVKRDALQTKARRELIEALHSHGIMTLEVQGTVVKLYYPQRHWRMMSDIDVIIPADKLDEAESVVQALGYQPFGFQARNPNGIEIDVVRENIAVELHTEFFDEESVTRSALDQPFSHAICSEDGTAVVSDTVFYLFHWLHTIKHCIYIGVGLRRIIDLYYLENAMKDKADQAVIDDVLKQYGFYETKQALLAVKECWFGNGRPGQVSEALKKDILQAGTHGHTDEYINRSLVREKKEGKRFVLIRYTLSALFLPKQALYKLYPFCERHHYPLVLCWIHRLNCSLFSAKKWKRLGNIIKRTRIDKE